MTHTPLPFKSVTASGSGAAEALAAIVAARHSCRAFRPERVPSAILEDIFRVAQRAPSWCNTQPWQVVLTSGDGTERLRRAMLAHATSGAPATSDFEFPSYQGSAGVRRLECALQLYGALEIGRGDRDRSYEQALENYRFFGAPHVAIVTTDKALGTWGAVDCGAYVGNVLLAATAHGLGSIAQAALAKYAELLREHFKLAQDRAVVCGIALGYEEVEHPANSYRTTRAKLDEVVSFADD